MLSKQTRQTNRPLTGYAKHSLLNRWFVCLLHTHVHISWVFIIIDRMEQNGKSTQDKTRDFFSLLLQPPTTTTIITQSRYPNRYTTLCRETYLCVFPCCNNEGSFTTNIRRTPPLLVCVNVPFGSFCMIMLLPSDSWRYGNDYRIYFGGKRNCTNTYTSSNRCCRKEDICKESERKIRK